MIAMLTLCRTGDHIVAASPLYGGTYSQFAVDARRDRHRPRPSSTRTTRRTSCARSSRTRALYGETLGNPADQRARHRGGRGDRARAPACRCDRQHDRFALSVPAVRLRRRHRRAFGDQVSSAATARPSAASWWNRGVSLGQRQISRTWSRRPRATTASSSVRPSATSPYTMKARMEMLRVLGPALSPLSAFLLMQGLETLHVRMDRHVQNARRGRGVSRGTPAVHGSTSRDSPSPYYALARKYLPDAAPARRLLTFGIRAARRPARSSSRPAVPVAPGQHRRRQVAGHPSGVDDPPPAVGGRAAGRGRAAGHGAAVHRHRDRSTTSCGTWSRRWRRAPEIGVSVRSRADYFLLPPSSAATFEGNDASRMAAPRTRPVVGAGVPARRAS